MKDPIRMQQEKEEAIEAQPCFDERGRKIISKAKPLGSVIYGE